MALRAQCAERDASPSRREERKNVERVRLYMKEEKRRRALKDKPRELPSSSTLTPARPNAMTSNRAERGRPGGYIDEDVTPDREGSLQSQVGSEGSSEAQLGEGQTAPVSPASVDDLTGAIDELQLAQTQARCDAVVKAVASRRTRRVRTRGRTTVVSRFNIIADTLALARTLDPVSILSPLVTSFTGAAEEGVDAGGLSCELLTFFFEEALAPGAGFVELPGNALTDSRLRARHERRELSGGGPRPLAMPLDRSERTEEDFEMLGRLILKAKVDGVPLPATPALAFWKYLRCPELKGQDALGVADMAEFDPTVARHLQALLDAPEGMVEAWSVYRADGELVTAELRHEYVQEAVHDKLIGGREAAMDAIRRGMRVSPALFAEVCCPSLSPRMTAALFCARELTPADILAAVQFPLEPESAAERLRGWVEEIVSGFDAAQCEGLLMLLTGLKGIPVGGLRNPDANPADVVSVAMCQCRACIKAYRGQAEEGCDELPRVSTCFWKLTLPACRSMNVLRSRLLTAIQWSAGFGSE